MRVGVPKETAEREKRVALVPEVVRKLTGQGHEVVVEPGAGQAALIPDDLFEEAGATLSGDVSNAQSTAYVVQAFLAAGRNPDRVRRRGSRSPLAYLRSLTQSNGLVRYSRTSTQTSVWVTGQAAMALARKPLPLARVPRRSGVATASAPEAAGATAAGSSGSPGASRAALSPEILRTARVAGMAFGVLMEPLS